MSGIQRLAERNGHPTTARTSTSVPAPLGRPGVLQPWLRAQSINVVRHAAALRPFADGEFGTDAVAPSRGHVQAVNALIVRLRDLLIRRTRQVTDAGERARRQPDTRRLSGLLIGKERAHDQVRAVETVWDFYFELFGQRQSRFAPWLLACDRIALDCYQVAFLGVAEAKSIPAPPPFSYVRTGFSPATYRRNIPLRRLGRQLNPFPLIQLPYHRLVNPWTLGAVLHEVSHNLQNELGLARIVPLALARRLTDAGLPAPVVATWRRWNRETYADLSGLLLGGPAVVSSLLDVIGRGPATVLRYGPRAPHPTPYLRAFLSIELLRRMGFTTEAERFRALWTRLYPRPADGSLPRVLLTTASRAVPVVVDTICYQPFRALGGKRLAEVLPFGQKEQEISEEAARRLASGNDPGIVPERFLIGAARIALDNGLGRPGVIANNFYEALGRR
jgi:hypothetical protein